MKTSEKRIWRKIIFSWKFISFSPRSTFLVIQRFQVDASIEFQLFYDRPDIPFLIFNWRKRRNRWSACAHVGDAAVLLSSAVVIALRDKTVYQSITAACLFVSTTRSSIHTHTHSLTTSKETSILLFSSCSYSLFVVFYIRNARKIWWFLAQEKNDSSSPRLFLLILLLHFRLRILILHFRLRKASRTTAKDIWVRFWEHERPEGNLLFCLLHRFSLKN